MKPLTFHELRVRLGRRELTVEEHNIETILDTATNRIWRLTPQEKRVMRVVTDWPRESQRNLAWGLGLKLKTFRTHLYNARKKLT